MEVAAGAPPSDALAESGADESAEVLDIKGCAALSLGHADEWRILSVNVTSLTAVRMRQVLQLAARAHADIISLQETSHGPCPDWAVRLARARGYGAVFSPPPPFSAANRRVGGTALLWNLTLGSGDAFALDGEHRCVGRRFGLTTVVAVYGHQRHEGRDKCQGLFRRLYGQLAQQGAAKAIVVGDMNYNSYVEAGTPQAYDFVHTPRPTFRGASSSPTRAACLGWDGSQFAEVALAAVPSHYAVVFSFRGELCEKRSPGVRLRRSAEYDWVRAPTEEERSRIYSTILADAEWWIQREPAEALRWWHWAAEEAMRMAVQMGAVIALRRGEVCKGAPPTVRPCAEAPAARLELTVRARRALRLMRAAEHQRRLHGGGAQLDPSQVRHWRAWVAEGLAPIIPSSQEEALHAATSVYESELQAWQRRRSREWYAAFRGGGLAATRAAGRVLKRAFAEVEPPTTAEDMRAQWLPWWSPAPPAGQSAAEEDAAFAERWSQGAVEAEWPAAAAQRPWTPPTWEQFADGVAATRGAAGLDGWTHQELRGFREHLPEFLKALLCVLRGGMVEYTGGGGVVADEAGAGPVGDAATRSAFYDMLAMVKVVGMPKRGGDRRPIAVASTIYRAWNRALLLNGDNLKLPDCQWAGRRGQSAVTATASWLSVPALGGAELDLRKAFDSVRFAVAERALRHQGAPEIFVRHLASAWRAPRLLFVCGQASAPITDQRAGLPPGDPISPGVLAAVLAMWTHWVTKRFAELRPWLYADDRSFVIQGVPEENGAEDVPETARRIDDVIAATVELDESVGLQLHDGKTQRWQPGDVVEHLGLRGAHGSSAALVPRDGWPAALLEAVARIPGPMTLREAAVAMYVLPRWLWAVPLVQLPPRQAARAVLQAITASRCSWWCTGRFFAERLHVHPRLQTAVRTLCASYVLPASAPLRSARMGAARVLGLRIVGVEGAGIFLQARRDDDRNVNEAIAAAAAKDRVAPRRGRPTFRADSAPGRHAVRTIARAVLVRSIVRQRRDSEGFRDIDIAANHCARVSKWKAQLPFKEASAWAIFRGGATWTPTRRYFRPGAAAQAEEEAEVDDEIFDVDGGSSGADGGFSDADAGEAVQPAAGQGGGDGDEGSTSCPECGFARCSVRHLVVECPALADKRREVATRYSLAPGWLGGLPRVATKSGWIVFAAHPQRSVREKMVMALGELGIAVVALGLRRDTGQSDDLAA
jgi:hypothetical protein